MRKLSFLQGQANFVLALCMSLSLFSCSNEDEFTPSYEKTPPMVEVSKLSDWLPGTRNSQETLVDMPVLRFKDERGYNETITQKRFNN